MIFAQITKGLQNGKQPFAKTVDENRLWVTQRNTIIDNQRDQIMSLHDAPTHAKKHISRFFSFLEKN